MLVKREALVDVGLWDEGYFLHCEDLDWCMRFRLKQWRVVFSARARVMHWRGACPPEPAILCQMAQKHRGMVRFYETYFRAQYPKVLWWWVVMGVWLRLGIIFDPYGVS